VGQAILAFDIFLIDRDFDCGTIGYVDKGFIQKPNSKVPFLPNLFPMKTHCQSTAWARCSIT
jgi:hypothetical protein